MTPDEFRAIRKRLGWSVEECAGRLNLKTDTVYKWEEGARRIHPTAIVLMKLFDSGAVR